MIAYRKLGLALVALLPQVAHAEKELWPAVGEAKRGGLLYQLHCAVCHGATGQGDGAIAASLSVPPGALKTGEAQVAHTNDDLYKAIDVGGAGVGKSTVMPAFGNVLTELEKWDLVAYVRTGAPRVLDYFPKAGRYLVKPYTIDTYGLERLKKNAGVTLTPAQATLQVVTVFNGDRELTREPVLEPDAPVTLDTLKPKEKLGYLVFVPVQLPGEAAPKPVGIGFEVNGKIATVYSATGTAEDAARDSELQAYVGQGAKAGVHKPFKVPAPKAVKPVKPVKGQKPPPPAAPPGAPSAYDSMDVQFQRAIEAITMYDKAERDRTWADAPSK